DASKMGIITLNDTSVNWNSFILNRYDNQMLPYPWNAWSVTNWGPGNATAGIQGGSMFWAFNQALAYLSLSYNGTVTSGHPGGLSVPSGLGAAVQAGFWYRTSSNFDGTVQVLIPRLNESASWTGDTVSPAMPPSSNWKYVSINDTLPFSTRYFTARFAAQASKGSVEIRD